LQFYYKFFTLIIVAYLTVILAVIVGFIVLQLVTHPTKSRIRKSMPDIKTKRFQFFPVLRVRFMGRSYHFHHWFNFSVLLALSAFMSSSFLDSAITRGFLVGGVLQGLTAKMERNIVCTCTDCMPRKSSRRFRRVR
jgi:hypothetical protein